MIVDDEYRILGSLAGHDWCRPLDVGGYNGSHHSRTLTKMVCKGWVERKQRMGLAGGQRGSWKYRITEAGTAAFSAESDRRAAERKAAKEAQDAASHT